MILRKLYVVLVIAGLSSCSGCAMNGMKVPFRDTLAALNFRKSNSTPASDSELSGTWSSGRAASAAEVRGQAA